MFVTQLIGFYSMFNIRDLCYTVYNPLYPKICGDTSFRYTDYKPLYSE